MARAKENADLGPKTHFSLSANAVATVTAAVSRHKGYAKEKKTVGGKENRVAGEWLGRDREDGFGRMEC